MRADLFVDRLVNVSNRVFQHGVARAVRDVLPVFPELMIGGVGSGEHANDQIEITVLENHPAGASFLARLFE
jgi:hypothetical protein